MAQKYIVRDLYDWHHRLTGILDDGENQYGMCRGEDGLYRITDLETGALLHIPGPINYIVAQTYIQLKRALKKFGGWLDAQKGKREFREAARKIRAANEAEEHWCVAEDKNDGNA